MDRAPNLSRRNFLQGRVAPVSGIRPPGVTKNGFDACTGCAACVEACPTGIISTAHGFPTLDFKVGEGTFCGECANACPEPVFSAETSRRFAHAVTISSFCFAK